MKFKYSLEQLKELQALPLEDKVALTKVRIDEFVSEMGGGKVQLLALAEVRTALFC